jgi:hypothetical protein
VRRFTSSKKMENWWKSVVNMVPSRNSHFEDSMAVANQNIIPEEFNFAFTPQMNLQVKGQYVTKGTLMLIDLITSNNWDRPIYFNNTSPQLIGINTSISDNSTSTVFSSDPKA